MLSGSYPKRTESIVVLFICIYSGLRINACIVIKTEATEEAMCIFWRMLYAA